MFYSWYNISYTVLIPDGIYQISDLNKHLQFTMINNGHYLQNASGANVYYIQWVLNPTLYSVQLSTFEVPNALPAGFSNPASMVLPTSASAPVVNISSKLNEIIGFTSGFQTTTANAYTSSFAPQVNQNSNILVSIDAINNPYANPSSVAYSFSVNVGVGEQISSQPSQLTYNKITRGNYNQLRVTFLNTNYQPIQIRDPQVSIILVIKDDTSD